MLSQSDELVRIVTKFAECGWDLIDAPSKAWLMHKEDSEALKTTNLELIRAVEIADQECGSCGCEFDVLYKRALVLLKAV